MDTIWLDLILLLFFFFCSFLAFRVALRQNTSSLKYRLPAKHTADAESPPPKDRPHWIVWHGGAWTILHEKNFEKHCLVNLYTCTAGHYIMLELLKNVEFRPICRSLVCLLGLSLPYYAFSIFFEHAVPLRLFWRIFWTVFVIVLDCCNNIKHTFA